MEQHAPSNQLQNEDGATTTATTPPPHLNNSTNSNHHNIDRGRAYRIRKAIYRFEEKCTPILGKIIPNFVIAHYIYIVGWIILTAGVVYAERNVSYIDALLLATSSCTQGGLAPLQLNNLKLYQQIFLYVGCFLTTIIFVHGSLTFIRLYWYEKRFDDIQDRSIMQYQMLRENTISNIRSRTKSMVLERNDINHQTHNAQEELMTRMQRFENLEKQSHEAATAVTAATAATAAAAASSRFSHRIDHEHDKNSYNILEKKKSDDSFDDNSGDDDYNTNHYAEDEQDLSVSDSAIKKPNPDIKFGELPKPRRSKKKFAYPMDEVPENVDLAKMTDDELINNYVSKVPTNYLSWNPTVYRNSKFITLTPQQKQELGGVEYQAMKLLSKILAAYYFGFQLLGAICLTAFANTKSNYQTDLDEAGVGSTWWAFFTSMSAMANCGFTLNPTGMVLYDENAFTLIVTAILILLGNTAFPIVLRFIIWVMRYFTKPLTLRHSSLSFLLDHPRRCFTILFPSGPTWWLFVVLLILNCVDWILFIILDYGKPVLDYLPHGYQVLAGLYQAISSRTAGFNVVNLATLNPALQLSYVVMMYISVLPMAISIRRTNVYEEQSLGVYNREKETHESAPKWKFIGSHLRKQLSFDLWFLFLAVFIICICEGGRILNGDINLGIFPIMFEVTSAYGTVGLSLGYPNSNASLCGEFSTISKLVIVAVLIRGRHRGLPNSIDRAIMLSSEKLDLRDDLETYNALKKSYTAQSGQLENMFPNISRAVTRDVSEHESFTREPTIAENIKDGHFPWKDIVHKLGNVVGKTAINLLTVNGTPVDEYSRKFTHYNGQVGISSDQISKVEGDSGVNNWIPLASMKNWENQNRQDEEADSNVREDAGKGKDEVEDDDGKKNAAK